MEKRKWLRIKSWSTPACRDPTEKEWEQLMPSEGAHEGDDLEA